MCWTISCNNPKSPSHCTPFSHVLITVFQLTTVRVSKCCTISSISATAPPATDGEKPASNRQPQANGCQPAASRRLASMHTDCWPLPAGVLDLPQHSVFQSTLCSIDLSAAYNDPRVFLNPLDVSLHSMFRQPIPRRRAMAATKMDNKKNDFSKNGNHFGGSFGYHFGDHFCG